MSSEKPDRIICGQAFVLIPPKQVWLMLTLALSC